MITSKGNDSWLCRDCDETHWNCAFCYNCGISRTKGKSSEGSLVNGSSTTTTSTKTPVSLPHVLRTSEDCTSDDVHFTADYVDLAVQDLARAMMVTCTGLLDKYGRLSVPGPTFSDSTFCWEGVDGHVVVQ